MTDDPRLDRYARSIERMKEWIRDEKRARTRCKMIGHLQTLVRTYCKLKEGDDLTGTPWENIDVGPTRSSKRLSDDAAKRLATGAWEP